MTRIWNVNTTGLIGVGEQQELVERATAEGVDVIAAQETYMKETTAKNVDDWLLISSGVQTEKRKTGVAIFISPQKKGSVANYLAVSERIVSVTLRTKDGNCAIVNHHAPDETRPLAEKEAHWEILNQVVSAIPSSFIILVVGDSNVRWHGRCCDELDILGPYIFGRGVQYMRQHGHENMDLAADFLRPRSFIF